MTIRLAGDIAAKSHDRAVTSLVKLASETIGPALEWLADYHGLQWIVLEDFLYPGSITDEAWAAAATCSAIDADPEFDVTSLEKLL